MSEPYHARLKAHLLHNDIEQAAFGFAAVTGSETGVTFHVEDVYLALPEDFDHQSGYHVALRDEALARIIKRAWDSSTAVVEFHSHPSARFPAAFSPSDMRGFAELVPHIRWRLRGKPYAAIVMAPGGFDALVWRGSSPLPEALRAMVVGESPLIPSGITFDEMERDYEERTI